MERRAQFSLVSWRFQARSLAIATLGIAGILPAEVLAQQQPPIEEMIVTASRTPTSVTDFTSSVTIISQQDLRDQLNIVRNVDQVLERLVPGIYEGNATLFSGSDAGLGPSLRGRPASVLVNGVPVNSLLRGNGIDTQLIDSNAIGRVEVKRGASAAFDFGASGGIIAFSTRQATSDVLEVVTIAGIDFADRRTGDSITYEAYAGLGQKVTDRFDMYAGFGFADNGIAVGPGGQNIGADEFRSYNVDSNIGYRILEDVEIRISGSFNRRNTNRSYLPPDNFPFFVEEIDDYLLPPGIRPDTAYLDPTDQSRDQHQAAGVLAATLTVENLAGGTLSLTGLYQSNAFERGELEFAFDTLENQAFSVLGQELENRRLGVRSSYNRSFEVGDQHDLQLTGGVDWLRDRLTRTANSGFVDDPPVTQQFVVPGYSLQPVDSGAPIFPISPPAELEGWAIFAQSELRLGRFLLNAGIRHEDSTPRSLGFVQGDLIIPQGNLPGFGVQLYNFGVVFDLTNSVQIYGGLNQGVEVTELGRLLRGIALDSLDEIGEVPLERLQNVDLQAARTTEYEFGVRGDVAKVEFTLAGYYSRAPLASRAEPPPGAPPGAVFVPVREPTEIWGVDATVDSSITDTLSAGAIFSWQDGRFRPEGEDVFQQIPYTRIAAPRLFGYVDWQAKPWLSLGLQGTQTFDARPFEDLPLESFGGSGASDGNIGGFFTLDASVTLSAGPGDLILSASNLLNRSYLDTFLQAFRDSFSQLPTSGRRISLTYTGRF